MSRPHKTAKRTREDREMTADAIKASIRHGGRAKGLFLIDGKLEILRHDGVRFEHLVSTYPDRLIGVYLWDAPWEYVQADLEAAGIKLQ